MKKYQIELIHEPSGTAVNFNVSSESLPDGVELDSEILNSLSIIVLDWEEVEEEL